MNRLPRLFAYGPGAEPVRQTLHHREGDGNDEDGDECRGQHATDHHRSQNLPRDTPGASCSPQRNAAKDESEGRHQDGAQAELGAGERCIIDALAGHVFLACELDDEDGVLGRQTNEHDQSDLRVDVVLQPTGRQREKSAKDRNRRAEQDAEGQRPALILRGQNKEDKEQRDAKDGGGRDALGGLLLLEGHALVVERHLTGHGLAEHLFEGLRGLGRAVAGRGVRNQLRRLIFVVAHGEFGPGNALHGGESRERYGVAGGVLHVEPADVINVRARRTLSFDIRLPLAPEAVEVIHQIAAHEGLQGLVDIGEVDTLLDRFLAIDIDVDLGNGGQVGRDDAGDLLPLVQRRHEFIDVVGEVLQVAARAIFEHGGYTTGGADTGDGWGRKGERNALLNAAKSLGYVLLDRLVLLVLALALIPRFKGDEVEGVISALGKAEQAEAVDADNTFDARRLQDDILDTL